MAAPDVSAVVAAKAITELWSRLVDELGVEAVLRDATGLHVGLTPLGRAVVRADGRSYMLVDERLVVEQLDPAVGKVGRVRRGLVTGGQIEWDADA